MVTVTGLRLPSTWTTVKPNNPAYDISATKLGDSLQVLQDLDFSTFGLTAAFFAASSFKADDGTVAFTIADATGIVSISDAKLLITDNADATKKLALQLSGLTTSTTRTLTVPDADDTLAVLALAQTLLLKTIVASSNTITDTSAALGDLFKHNGTRFVRFAKGTSLQQIRVNAGGTDLEFFTPAASGNEFDDSLFRIFDNADNTKKVAFETSGITTATTRVLTVPNFDGTIATLAGAEILSNKTFTAPKFADLGFIADANGNELIIFDTVASAVNELTLANAAAGTPVLLTLSGGDTDVSLKFVPKGAGVIFGARETFAYPLTDETTLPTTGVKYTTEPWPYDFKITDVIAGLTTAGTGAAKAEFDILKEDTVNSNTFTTIFTTRPTIDASEFTSTTAAAAMALASSAIVKGKRLQLKIYAIDSNSLMRGVKLAIIGYATAV